MNEGIQPRPRIDRAEGEHDDPAVEPEEGRTSLDGDEVLQKEVLSKIKTHNQKGKQNRMAEVQSARDQRLYFKDIQQFYWNEDEQDLVFGSAGNEPYSRSFNIFQGYGKIFIALFMGAKGKVKAEADDPFDGMSIRDTAQARTYERVYRKFNDSPAQQLEVSRLMWTDGRVVTRLADKDGRQITEFWGVLESRLPIAAIADPEVPLKNCSLIQLENEYPMVQMKRDYPDAKKKLSFGAGDSYERNARTAVKRQAGTDTTIDAMSGEDGYGHATKTWSYMRPEFFEDFSDATSKQLKDSYPDGLLVVHSGDVYLESSPCDPDSCLDVIHALPGDGQSRGSVGKTTMGIQDSANTAQNLIEETFDHGIPTTYYDQRTDIDNLNRQREMPGASRKASGIAGQALGAAFYETTSVQPSAQLMSYTENLRGPQAQFAAALPPAAFGQEMADQKTASGYQQARTQALGQMTIVWKPFTAWQAREMTRAVKMASQGQKDIVATLPSMRKGGKDEPTKISPGSLAGLSFRNDSDENFPETYTERGNKMMSILQAGGEMADALPEEPDNLYLLKDVWGLDDLVIPGEDIRNNVLEDIAQMENEQPQPNPQQMAPTALPAMGQQAPTPPLISSVQIDPDYLDQKDLAMGYAAVKRWINSPTGREAKVAKPLWFQNVHLYGLQYKQAIPPPAGPATKPPGVSFNGNLLPPETQAALLAADGIHADPASIQAVQQQQVQNEITKKTAGQPVGATNG